MTHSRDIGAPLPPSGRQLRTDISRPTTPTSGKINQTQQPTHGGATSSHRAGASASHRSQPYPFPDDSFDLAWLSGYWFPRALPELRRVLRPDGRIVVTTSGLVPYVSYAWDPGLEARLHAAHRRGYDAMHAATLARMSQRTLYGQLRASADLLRDLEVRTVLIERWGPVPPLMVEHCCQNFALFVGGMLAEQADAEDWTEVARLYDPADGWLFDRPDAYVVQTMLVATVRMAR